MKRISALLILTSALSGCAVHKHFVPVGGSRSDGTIKMAFDHGMFENPQVDANQARALAKQRCAAWGYSDAEAFGSSMKTCIMGSSSGCNTWRVTVEYQCTGTIPTAK